MQTQIKLGILFLTVDVLRFREELGAARTERLGLQIELERERAKGADAVKERLEESRIRVADLDKKIAEMDAAFDECVAHSLLCVCFCVHALMFERWMLLLCADVSKQTDTGISSFPECCCVAYIFLVGRCTFRSRLFVWVCEDWLASNLCVSRITSIKRKARLCRIRICRTVFRQLRRR